MIRNDDLFSRLEKFKEVTESPTYFDSEKAQILLHELKIILMKHDYLSSDANNINFAERLMFREVFELAIIMCVRMENFNDIQNYFNQLSFFYFKNDDLPQSQRMFTMIDVSLLMSLAFNKNEEYNIKIAQIRRIFPNLNFIIQFVLDVELCLNSNSISKLSVLIENSPSYLFDIFLSKIMLRIRKTLTENEIKKSNSLTPTHLAKLLQFDNESEFNDFLDLLQLKISDDGEIIVKQEEVHPRAQNARAKLEDVFDIASRFNSLL